MPNDKPTPVSDPEIEALMAAAEIATPRPWEARYLADDDFVIRNPGFEIYTPEYDVAANVPQGAPIRKREDAEYIALAANLAPKLVARIRELEGALERQKSLIDRLRSAIQKISQRAEAENVSWISIRDAEEI